VGCDSTTHQEEVIRLGREAMQRQRRRFADWMLIAAAIDAGQTEIMRQLHLNKPHGGRYEKAMAAWLVANGFKEINKGTRWRTLECLRNRVEIETWLAGLTDGDRFKLNHPDTVLRKWKKKTNVPDPNKTQKISPKAKLKESIARLDEENHRLKQEIARGGGDLWTPDDKPEDIARVMVEKLSPTKAEKVARAIIKMLKARSSNESESDTPRKIPIRYEDITRGW